MKNQFETNLSAGKSSLLGIKAVLTHGTVPETSQFC